VRASANVVATYSDENLGQDTKMHRGAIMNSILVGLVAIAASVASGQAIAQSSVASSSDAILQRLDALDKRNERLEQDNAMLRARLRAIEERRPRATAVTVRSVAPSRDQPPATAMAMVPPATVAKTPVPPVAPYSWTGFYVGGHFGGGLVKKNWNDLTPIDGLNAPTFTDTAAQDMGSHNATGLLGGIQGGYNWQFAHWVLGIEGQYSFADLSGDHQSTSTGGSSVNTGVGSTFSVTANTVTGLATRIDGIGTIAGRIGYASDPIDRTMIYVKGGAAYVRDRFTESTQQSFNVCVTANGVSNCTAGGFTGSFSANQDRWGWMGGVGLEYGLTQDWSAKVEYDFLGFGTSNVNMPGTLCQQGTLTCAQVPRQTMAIHQDLQLLKFGVNYHFH
jgi:outer membrane immunogenic protein